MNFRETYWQRLTIQSNLFGDYLPSSHIYYEVRTNLQILFYNVYQIIQTLHTARSVQREPPQTSA